MRQPTREFEQRYNKLLATTKIRPLASAVTAAANCVEMLKEYGKIELNAFRGWSNTRDFIRSEIFAQLRAESGYSHWLR